VRLGQNSLKDSEICKNRKKMPKNRIFSIFARLIRKGIEKMQSLPNEIVLEIARNLEGIDLGCG